MNCVRWQHWWMRKLRQCQRSKPILKRALLNRIKTALGGKSVFDITDYDDDDDATIQTKIDDPKTKESDRQKLQALLINRKTNKTFELQPGGDSYIGRLLMPITLRF